MYTAQACAVLTSTTSSQTVTVPNGAPQMTAYNAGANPVYMKWASTVAVPTTFSSGERVMFVAPATSRVFSIPVEGGTLAYIASTAGGSLILSTGSGTV